ncbi:PPE family protein [Mycobacterium intracellulare]|uniref:PPE family protein n=1 Tax=Mycobacterium intracellulare subsp. chimaera TaxID=222805 RepID=A0A7U5MNG4_MYCIT|nr:PPE family protein [Mycobacterium intracellulare]ASL16803.1 PPE family protein [Mycobacterium intracellulare subsp. chimaera]ASQ87805.1 hypothetical protein CE197_21135 [Mycobacterium intracellulare subsp. chimaera]MCF1811485.1 PPE family protein [Mycobacterium intracellulare subsp. intracellulare]MDM3925723.1 PPE family protein [Mycobacterium intracellulare subsp. chimaera]MDS0335585.1 PPE family protein [Mycobacterium intracellulare]
MDWAFLPPEINSARMYTGPGMGSLLAAAGSWDALSAELSSAAEGYESALSGLDLQWRGPAAQAMAFAAIRYAEWLQVTAEQTRQTAMQARTAAAAYEQAYAMTVPPPVITANRTLLAALVASNIVGQNTAAIADTEAQYADYWAQDAAAMSAYSVSSAAATQLPRFAPATNSTNESGVSAQKAAVTAANSNAAANKAVTQTFSALDDTTGTTVNNYYYLDASTTSAANANANAFRVLDAIQGTGLGFSAPYNMEQFVSGIIGAENNLGILAKPVAAAPALAAPALRGATAGLGGGLGGGLGNVMATLSRAGSIGPMSVPASWAAPTSTHISPLTPAGFTTLPGTEEPMASGYPGYPGMPGGGASRTAGAGVPPRYGVRLTVMPRPPAAG